MPVYTCTTTASMLTADTRSALAQETGRIHASINHVPSTYVNVVFHELPAGGVYTDGVPANPVLVNGWVRTGHPEAETTRLATEIATAVSRIANVAADRVLVVIQSSRRGSRSKAAVSCPSPAKSRPGSPQNGKAHFSCGATTSVSAHRAFRGRKDQITVTTNFGEIQSEVYAEAVRGR